LCSPVSWVSSFFKLSFHDAAVDVTIEGFTVGFGGIGPTFAFGSDRFRTAIEGGGERVPSADRRGRMEVRTWKECPRVDCDAGRVLLGSVPTRFDIHASSAGQPQLRDGSVPRVRGVAAVRWVFGAERSLPAVPLFPQPERLRLVGGKPKPPRPPSAALWRPKSPQVLIVSRGIDTLNL
jgi:hypothetical protein